MTLAAASLDVANDFFWRWRLSQTLRVVMAQLNMRVGDVHGNVDRIIAAAGWRAIFWIRAVVSPVMGPVR